MILYVTLVNDASTDKAVNDKTEPSYTDAFDVSYDVISGKLISNPVKANAESSYAEALA